MLALAAGVTAPAGLRRFPLPLRRLFVRALLRAAVRRRPARRWWRGARGCGQPLVELALDAALFALLTLPGLELARRRFGLALGFGPRA